MEPFKGRREEGGKGVTGRGKEAKNRTPVGWLLLKRRTLNDPDTRDLPLGSRLFGSSFWKDGGGSCVCVCGAL